ncbi:MAG: fatty acid-binding protein DegV [Clostridiales bacterium]|nr:MAG: fatty acid-binding protein DegV [Clostridiales bacterium]
MAFIIITESTCDLSRSYIEAHPDLAVIPLTYYIDGREYRDDGKGLSSKEFYDILRKGKTATTGQVGIHAFCQEAVPLLEQGFDLLYLGMSSGMSGSFQSGFCALQELRQQFPARAMEAVDSKAASLGLGLLVHLCLAQKAAGRSFSEVCAFARKSAEELCEWFTVDDLMFLKRGGRISAATALVGAALGIKPILHVDSEGRLVAVGKVRGRELAIRTLAGKIAALTAQDVIAVSHGDCPEDAEKLVRLIRERLQFQGEILLGPVGPVVGAHGGPGSLALFFKGDNR